MSDRRPQALHIGDLTAPLPIIQGGMGVGVSLAGLASAVANEGGIGVIATAGIGMFEADFYANYLEANTRALRREIRRAKELSQGILGVNIMVALSNFGDIVKTALEEGVDIIFSGAGLPLDLPHYLTGTARTKLVPIVSSGRAARIIAKRWTGRYAYPPDAVVVEGTLAGGHLGFKPEQIGDPAYALERLVAEVLAEVRPFEEKHQRAIPVVAAGGIYTGADIHKFLQSGAAGVQMATRFVTTHECDASLAFKETYIRAKQEDIVIIKSPVGMPGRAIRNQFIDDINNAKKAPVKCPYHCIITCDYTKTPYCIALALTNAQRGNLKCGFAFAGANAYRATEIVSVKELIGTLLEEYAETSA
ncbi:MAG: nitronate monooxygenase [candidate division NC10 bacterium]|nr:nitronate monooxygenase [candidate division NC10 bacterium]